MYVSRGGLSIFFNWKANCWAILFVVTETYLRAQPSRKAGVKIAILNSLEFQKAWRFCELVLESSSDTLELPKIS